MPINAKFLFDPAIAPLTVIGPEPPIKESAARVIGFAYLPNVDTLLLVKVPPLRVNKVLLITPRELSVCPLRSSVAPLATVIVIGVMVVPPNEPT